MIRVTLLVGLIAALASCNKPSAPQANAAMPKSAEVSAAAVSPESASAPQVTKVNASPAESGATQDKQNIAPDAKPVASSDQRLGYYVGYFEATEEDDAKDPMYSNKINVSIDSISGDTVTGHSVCAGNNRPFSGTLKQGKDGVFDLVLKEPGDDKSDGVFTCNLDPKARTLKGEWVANDKKAAVTKRSYELAYTTFKYNPRQVLGSIGEAEVYGGKMSRRGKIEAITDDAGKYNASVRVLKSHDVENMYKRDLEVMRNTIYARHGYSFRNRAMRDFFDNYVEWYVPVSTDVSHELTDVEKKNIELLKRYEDHASTYYDRFGR